MDRMKKVSCDPHRPSDLRFVAELIGTIGELKKIIAYIALTMILRRISEICTNVRASGTQGMQEHTRLLRTVLRLRTKSPERTHTACCRLSLIMS